MKLLGTLKHWDRTVGRIGLVAAAALCVFAGILNAQDDSAAGNTAQDTAAKADKQPDGGDPKAAFYAKFDEWKNLLQELRQLRHDFQEAPEADTDTIRKKWDEAIAKGTKMIPELRSAAIKAYEAAPNQDAEISKFLLRVMEDEQLRDHSEDAMQIVRVFDSNGYDDPHLALYGGLAAFATNDFDLAEKLLKKAGESGIAAEPQHREMGAKAAQFLGDIEDYKKFWADEQAIRAKEAEADDLPRVKLTTSKGEIVVELYENEAPDTVGNFISLAKAGFYDGLTFHRVMGGFMAQGGCPVGDGNGGPGYRIYCECVKPEHRKHFRGSLSMAKTPAPNTGGSQFFICYQPAPHLNGEHTVFGRVVSGLDVAADLLRRTPDKPGEKQPDVITKAEVIRDRGHEYKPNKVQ